MRTRPRDSGADVAQLAEQLPCKQQVAGSSPAVGSPVKSHVHNLIPNRPRRWTTSEVRRLEELLEEGFATTTIGQILGGRSSRAVWEAMRRHNLTFPAGSPHFYQRPRDGKMVRAGVGNPWTAAERQLLTDLSKLQLTAASIAARIPGRSPRAVAHWRRVWGLAGFAPYRNRQRNRTTGINSPEMDELQEVISVERF